MRTQFLFQSLKRRNNLGDVGADVRIILELILKE
jgi:hypothetical protein